MTKEAKPDAWMPLYIGDWDGDTGHLTNEQDGAYGRLVRWYWRNGALPDEDGRLASIIRADLRTWRRLRPVLAQFFAIADGRWVHKRVESEKIKWSARKAKAVEKAEAAAKARWARENAPSNPPSNAPSKSQALLEQCPSSSSTEVEAKDASTLCGNEHEFLGPKEVRDAFVRARGDDWVRSYIDPCGWQDVPERALIPANAYAGAKLIRDGRTVLADLSLTVLERRVTA